MTDYKAAYNIEFTGSPSMKQYIKLKFSLEFKVLQNSFSVMSKSNGKLFYDNTRNYSTLDRDREGWLSYIFFLCLSHFFFVPVTIIFYTSVFSLYHFKFSLSPHQFLLLSNQFSLPFPLPTFSIFCLLKLFKRI